MTTRKHPAVLLALGLAASLSVNADESAGNQKKANGDKPQANAENLKEESSEALDALADYSAAQKDKASATARDLVARLDKRVELLREDLEANWDRMSESTREERKAAINALAEKRDQLKEQFQQLSQRSGKAWDELKSGFVRSYRALTADEATASGDETADTEAAN
jgi:uncharacterized membrane protein YccC